MRLTVHGSLAGVLLCLLAACTDEAGPGPSTDPCGGNCLPGQICDESVDPPQCVFDTDSDEDPDQGEDADAADLPQEDADATPDLVDEPDATGDADAAGDPDVDGTDTQEDPDADVADDAQEDPDAAGDPEVDSQDGDLDASADPDDGSGTGDPDADEPDAFLDPDDHDFGGRNDPDIDTGRRDEDPDVSEIAEDADGDDADLEVRIDGGDSGDADLFDEPEVLCELAAVQSLSVALDLPRAVNITWVYPAESDADGFIVRQNDGVTEFDVVTLGTPTARAGRVVNLDPGRTYTFRVLAFGSCDDGSAVQSPPTSRVISIPVPTGLIATDGLVTVGSELVPDSGLGQKHSFVFALTYAAQQPAVLYRNGVRLTNSSLAFAVDPDLARASITANGVFRGGAPGQAAFDATFAWTGGSLTRTFPVNVVDSTQTGTLQVTLISDVAFGDTVDIVVRGPDSLLTAERLDVPKVLELAAGRYELEITDDLGIFQDVRTVAVVRPGETTVVTRALVPLGACREVPGDSPTPFTITASDGSQLFLPPFALRATAQVCLTPLPGLAAPWRSLERLSPIPLQQGYIITGPSDLRVNAELEVPLDVEVAQFIRTELDGYLRAFELVRTCPTATCEAPTEPSWLPGPRSVTQVDAGPPATARFSLNRLGQTLAINMCSAFFGSPGSCAIELRGCAIDDETIAEAESEACGDSVANVPGLTTLENAEVVGEADELLVPLSYALGEQLAREDFPFCIATPCPGGACDCLGVSTVHSCGYTIAADIGTLDSLDGTLTPSHEVALFVPSTSACAENYDTCGAAEDTCPDDVEVDCPVVCPWTPPSLP
jgi:hypothetical protein